MSSNKIIKRKQLKACDHYIAATEFYIFYNNWKHKHDMYVMFL